MLVFQEGLPRSGKSYDTVLNHILPALKRGRPVFARLNGMENDDCRNAISKRLGVTRSYVDEKLVHIDTADVIATFCARQTDGVKWTIDPKFKNALIVIDEIHEFFVGGTREQLAPSSEQFFALHGHYGMDIVVMSQHYKRTHTAVRYRVERKNVFQKMSALGSKGEKLYRQTYYQAVQPDRYEQVNAETHAYDATVYECYHGIVPAQGENDEEVTQAVYSGGRSNVWKSMIWRAAIIVPVGIFAVWFLVDFFTGGGTKLVKSAKATTPVYVARAGDQGEPMPGVAQPMPGRKPGTPPPPPDPRDGMTPGQRYVWDLGEKGRVRLAAVIGEGADARGLVEWVTGAGEVADRLSFAQLRALGVRVSLDVFGVLLEAKDQTIIATSWPLNLPLREEQPRLYDTSQGAGAGAGVSVSEPQPGPVSHIGAETQPVSAYGDFRG